MAEKEEDQVYVQLSVKILSLSEREDDTVGPSITRDEEDNHKEEERPPANPIELYENAVNFL